LAHLVTDYLPLADDWQVCDNSGNKARVLATSKSHAIQAVQRLIQP
jgi:predicted ABC-type ATPase